MRPRRWHADAWTTTKMLHTHVPMYMQERSCAHAKLNPSQNKIIKVLTEEHNEAQLTDKNGVRCLNNKRTLHTLNHVHAGTELCTHTLKKNVTHLKTKLSMFWQRNATKHNSLMRIVWDAWTTKECYTCMYPHICRNGVVHTHTKFHPSQNKIVKVLTEKPNSEVQLTDENGAPFVLLLDGSLRLRALGEGRFEHEAPQGVVALKVRHPLLELLLLKVWRHKAHLDVAILGVKVSRVHLLQAEKNKT